MSKIPEETHDAFKEMLNRGRSPKSTAAAITWLTTDKVQVECAEEFGCSVVSLRHCSKPLKELLDKDLIVGDERGIEVR